MTPTTTVEEAKRQVEREEWGRYLWKQSIQLTIIFHNN